MVRAIKFRTREEWRTWLEGNHDKQKEVWLVHYKKHVNETGLTLEEGVDEAICFGRIDSRLQRIDDRAFMLRYSPRGLNSVWSKINRERAERMIRSGRMTRAGLIPIQQAKKTGVWDKALTNLRRERIPPDLKLALMRERKAWINFQNFANSYRNMYIFWVNGARTKETREKRIGKVVEQASKNKKLIVPQEIPILTISNTIDGRH